MSRLREWARLLKRDVVALWVAARDPRTPLGAKIVAACVAAYALSPVDLIPDFVPLLGYLDDLLIVPLGTALAIRLIPPGLMSEFRVLAEEISARPSSRAGLLAIILIWALATGLAGWWVWEVLETADPLEQAPSRVSAPKMSTQATRLPVIRPPPRSDKARLAPA
nr:hypothetical protein RNT25_02197 [arsenite-oxidising bacterium NT-25]